MSQALHEELEEALRSLQTLVKRKQAPSRYDARRLLLALGALLSTGEAFEVEAVQQRMRKILEGFEDPGVWEQAVQQEMELACSEHVLGVDPRYLDHPRFDFEYVVQARERLEMRFLALESLEAELDPSWSERVAEADERLAPYLEARDPGK